MGYEDYARLVRLCEDGAEVVLEISIDATFHDQDLNSYNTIAEIPGTDGSDEFVLAGAHLDSWFVGDGASDNGAGVAVVMEAARILKALDIRPKRTIRFALWTAEEQTFGGSLHYVTTNLATRPAPEDPERAALDPSYWFDENWPIEKLDGYDDLVAYFNLDHGAGRIRGVYAENNLAIKPIFEAWLKPFACARCAVRFRVRMPNRPLKATVQGPRHSAIAWRLVQLMEMLGINEDSPLQITVSGNSLIVTPVHVGVGQEGMAEAIAALRPRYGEMLRRLAE